MTSSTSHPTFAVDARLLRAGVALLCVGGITWLIGAVLSTTALGQALKKWVDQMEESPSEMAQRRLHQLKVAAAAGSKAWREDGTERQ
jgi:hypothetical protein